MENFDTDKQALERAVHWAAKQEGFVAFVLVPYQKEKGISDEQLTASLSCGIDNLSKLMLCLLPQSEPPMEFRLGVRQIAEYVGADPNALGRLFRDLDVLEAFNSQKSGRSQGVLLVAARDDETESESAVSQDISEKQDQNPEGERNNQNAAERKSPKKKKGQPLTVEADEYEEATGEALERTLDLDTWRLGEDLAELYSRLGNEIEQAIHQEERSNGQIRREVFPKLRNRPGAPAIAGVYQAREQMIEHVHQALLFNGAVEACDGTSVVHDTLAVTIAQIGVCSVSYQGNQGSWVHHLYRRDLRTTGLDPVEEALELLERRKKRDGLGDFQSRRDKLSELTRRGIMTYAERAVLMEKSTAPWRMGHGNPFAYELLTGSGMHELVGKSIVLLEKLVAHEKFVFVASEPSDRFLLMLGNALRPLEYAIFDDMSGSIEKLLDGHYTGEWRQYRGAIQNFAQKEGRRVIRGVFRSSLISPPQMFYAHADCAHEAVLVAMADSTLLEHRGFPMLLDIADRTCASTFGADSFVSSIQSAYTEAGSPYRYTTERQTRA